jgi:4'-phosphopantetheinyl transferase
MASTGSRHPGSWSQAPSKIAFPTGHVDIWKICLDRPALGEPGAGVLSPGESLRASRFRFEKDRVHFVRCRSALRNVLARYIGFHADEIDFEYGSKGKPQLAAEQNPRGLQFNVSHSANMALIAIGSQNRLGVDVERIRGDVDHAVLAERFFSRRERAALEALPTSLRLSGFFACWTRKESFLKATGDGFSFALADFSVSTHPDVDPSIEEILGNAEVGKQWFLADLSVADGYRASVCVNVPFSDLRTYLQS